jgi:arsenite/tail-anchored protein-transporting ATPase
VTDLFDRRMLIVAGKGGVGRTTVSAALGLAAAATGKRVAIVELSGMANLAPLFGLSGRSFSPRTVAPNVDILSMTAAECLNDFGQRKLRLTALVSLVMRSRIVRAFLDAVPGLHDLLQMGKLENMLSEPLTGDPIYDVMVLDAPATGHGLTLLAAARAMREMTRVGPFADLAKIIEDFLADRDKAGLILVTLPESLPVSETLEMRTALTRDGTDMDAVVINMVSSAPLPEPPSWDTARRSLETREHPDLASLLDIIEKTVARHGQQTQVLERLRNALPPEIRVHQLPRIGHGALTPDALAQLGQHLGAIGAP